MLKRRSAFTTLLVLALFISAEVFADNWNAGTGGNPSRYSRSSEHGPQTPDTLWQGGLSAVIAQPAVIEGNIVAMSRIFNLSDVLHGTLIVAHDLTTGDTLWTADLPVDFPSSDWRNRVCAIRDGRVYASRSGNTNSSYLYALNAQTGTILWRSQDSLSEASTESPSFAPNGDLIIGNWSNLERINATNGARVWRTNRVSPTSNGSEASVYGDRVYIWEQSPQGPKVSSFDLATGAARYSSPGLGGLVQQASLFVGPDGTVFAPRTQNNPITDYLVAFTDNGAALVERWRVPLGYVPFGTFGVGPDGSVYSYTPDRRVIRISTQTGQVLDSSIAIQTDFLQPRMAIDASGRVYLTNGGFSQGAFYSFNPDLSLRWTVTVPGVNIGGPAIGPNGTLIVCGTGTNVIAFRGASSTPILDLAITPINPPIQIPANGGAFRYNINIHNTTGQSQTFQVWNKIRAGSTYYQVFGPVQRTLPGGANPTRQLMQSVAGSIPSGINYYISYLGTYPGTVIDSSFFTFTKLTTSDGGLWFSESCLTGDVFDEYDDEIVAPANYSLLQNHPNPFNLTTNLRYELRDPAFVNLSVYDVSGRKLVELVNGWREAGAHNVIFDGAGLAAGVYIYRLQAGGFNASGKMVMVK